MGPGYPARITSQVLRFAAVTDFCSELSELRGEPIAGTAAEAKVWLAIEYCEPWEAKGVEKAAFPEAVRERLEAWDEAIEDLRVQLIRRPGRDGRAPVVLVGVCEPGGGVVVELALGSIAELADVDVPSIVARVRAGDAPHVGTIVRSPVVLVCTHGKRDRCCAKRGTPVYERMAAHRELVVWQTSHLGGHRFAATMVWLPHGICYGRVRADEVDDLVAALHEGNVFRIDRYRGRSCYSAAGQAAEAMVREQFAAMGVDAVVVEQAEDLGNGWRVELRAGDRRVVATLELETSSTVSPPSCGKDPEPIEGFALVDLR
jgi:hypothetical protein